MHRSIVVGPVFQSNPIFKMARVPLTMAQCSLQQRQLPPMFAWKEGLIYELTMAIDHLGMIFLIYIYCIYIYYISRSLWTISCRAVPGQLLQSTYLCSHRPRDAVAVKGARSQFDENGGYATASAWCEDARCLSQPGRNGWKIGGLGLGMLCVPIWLSGWWF